MILFSVHNKKSSYLARQYVLYNRLFLISTHCIRPLTPLILTNGQAPSPSPSRVLPAAKEFSCLGDWFVGKNHYFAVANTKESRKDEKYRCFVRNRDDDIYMGHSITPECSVLNTPENSPFRFRMDPGEWGGGGRGRREKR